jgi:hypothetical protein
MNATRLASLLSEFIIDDLKLRRKDWALVADILADSLRMKAHNDYMQAMLAGNQAVELRKKNHV